jgi:CheY-like chemotaxis protein
MHGEEPKTILLIDQNDEDVDMFRRAAGRSCEVEVHAVHSGQEATGYLLRGEDPIPQLIIVDLDLPSADAFALLRYVNDHRELKAIPVVILTGPYQEEQIQAARMMGAEAVFLKPDVLEEMERLVYALCEVYIHFALPPLDRDREVAMR